MDWKLQEVLLYINLLEEMCDTGNNDLSYISEEFFRWIKWMSSLWYLLSYIQKVLRRQKKSLKIKCVFKTPSPIMDSELVCCLQTSHLNTILFKSLISLYIEIAKFLRLSENWPLLCQVRVHLVPHMGCLLRRWIIKGNLIGKMWLWYNQK